MRNWSAFQFSRRNKILSDSGIETYRSFLASDVWKNLKKRTRESKNTYWHKCIVCGSKEKLNLHHIKYKKAMLKDGDIKNIRPLCEKHHKETHDFAREKNIHLGNAFRRLLKKYHVSMTDLRIGL